MTKKPAAIYYRIMRYQASNLAYLNKLFELTEYDTPDDTDEDDLAKVEVLFAPLGFTIDATRMDCCPNLRAIVSNTTGIPHIDAEAAEQRNIAVCALHDEQEFLETITPTAEHAVGLILAGWRRIVWSHLAAMEGKWDRRPWGAPKMVSRLSLGIVGMGRLGRKVAKAAKALEMEVDFFDPYVDGGAADILTLARKSTILSLHAPANDETKNIVSREVLESLPKGAMVVNTARGELLDETALLELLQRGHIGCAALDTVQGEYSSEFMASFRDNPLAVYARSHDNLLLTPHIGGSTIDAWSDTERFVIRKAAKVLGLGIV